MDKRLYDYEPFFNQWKIKHIIEVNNDITWVLLYNLNSLTMKTALMKVKSLEGNAQQLDIMIDKTLELYGAFDLYQGPFYERESYYREEDNQITGVDLCLLSRWDEMTALTDSTDLDDIYEQAVSFLFGIDCIQDEYKALELFEYGARYRHGQCISSLGYMYETGFGVEEDLYKAADYYEQAAFLGDEVGLFNYGLCHLEGIGIEQDEAVAIPYITQAADAKLPRAILTLGECYKEGRGVLKDEDYAFDLYHEAAGLGSIQAMLSAAELFFLRKSLKDE